MRVDVVVQHHPSRADILDDLLGRLPPARIVSDPEPAGRPSAWRTHRACLETRDPGASHILVVQDDAAPADGFPSLLEAAVAARPDRMLVLWHGGAPAINVHLIRAALDRRRTWARLDPQQWVPAVAVVWPARMIQPSLDFVDAQGWPPGFTADDEIIGHALRYLGEEALACVPSLIEHPDEVPSVIGKRHAWAGKDPGRVAAFFDPAPDAAAVDWDSGDR